MRTAEFVTPKHPDKICDQISDAILDECLKQDPMSRVAVETMGGHGIITITGEVTTGAHINIRDIVESVVGQGYGIQSNIVTQSAEIGRGVDIGGAGDQGIMRGYAVREGDNFMPREYELARDLCRLIYGKFPFDGKTQVTLDNDGAINTVVATFQNAPKGELEGMIEGWLKGKGEGVKILANPAGDWSQGGFDADTGVTGRKLCIDNYGPRFPIGGGAFSGKDSTKVDRSGAYMARKIAIDALLNDPEIDEASVEIAYAIGEVQPVEAVIMTALKSGEKKISRIEGYDLSPRGIIDMLKLREPKFRETAEWGHFGNGFIWG